jgi:hypothetical protein
MLVLSDDKMTPRIVAPDPSWVCNKFSTGGTNKKKNYLNIPSVIA